jgi:DNA-binding response OmpR family regulator
MINPKVMLIEDDYTMLTLLRTLLNFEGFEVSHPDSDENVEVIVNAIRAEMPSAILLDVNLRQVNGFDVLKKVRQDEGLNGMRVLMSSGLDFSNRCIEAGADAFIQKPYMPEELIGKIRQVLGETS